MQKPAAVIEAMCKRPEIVIRNYEPADAEHLLKLFRRTIRLINTADYNAQQIDAWASDDVLLQDWQQRFEDKCAIVAVAGDQIAGFADMRKDGYLDRLFVSADFQRQGVATALMQSLKEHAGQIGLKQMTTDASITARPFFASAGFQLVREQTVHYRGQDFTNFHMKLTLP